MRSPQQSKADRCRNYSVEANQFDKRVSFSDVKMKKNNQVQETYVLEF